MGTYWSILEKVKGSSLRLTKMDQDIYDHLMETFPDFDPAATINEDEMKSKAGKDKWRPFMMAYEKKIEDFNFGTMLRNSPKVEYEEDNTIFGTFLLPPYGLVRHTTDSRQCPGCSSTLSRSRGKLAIKRASGWART